MHALPVREYLKRAPRSHGFGYRLPHRYVEPCLIVNPYFSEKTMSKVSKVVVLSAEIVEATIIKDARANVSFDDQEAEFKLTFGPWSSGSSSEPLPKEIVCCAVNFVESDGGVKVSTSVEYTKQEMDTILVEGAKMHAGQKGLGSSNIHYEMETADVLKEVVVTFNQVGK
jgi:hypothetical protein